MQREEVKSKQILSVGYDATNGVLEIEFGNAVYQYDSVLPEEHTALMTAESIGTHFAAHIRGTHATFKIVDGARVALSDLKASKPQRSMICGIAKKLGICDSNSERMGLLWLPVVKAAQNIDTLPDEIVGEWIDGLKLAEASRAIEHLKALQG